jgi:hypothetical protein
MDADINRERRAADLGLMSSTRLLALPAALVLLGGTAGAATNGAYKGRTDQNRAVTFTIKNGKVRAFQAGVLTHCNTMNNNRFSTDAIANLPAIPIKGSRFDYKDDDAEVHGRIRGAKVTGTVSLSRADSYYDSSQGMTFFGVCGAYDRKFTAKR